MLIGRKAEQAAVTRLVAGARVGRSGVLVLAGEAGIGKSALLEDAAAQAEGMQVLRAAGSESERNVPFAGLLQLLRPVLGLLDKIPGPQAEALGVGLALREGTTTDRFAVGAATLSLVSRCAEDRPLLLLIDDAHALDRPSAEAVVFVARRLMADRVALVLTTREHAGSPVFEADLPQLHLGGLELTAASRLLARHAQQPVTADLVARVHAATEGNPLAIVEFAGEIERLDRVGPHTPLPVPQGAVRSFTRRIAALSPPAQGALLLAAISDGDLGVIARAADDLKTDETYLAEAENAGLVAVTAGRIAFRHSLVPSSAYAAAPEALRRRAHAAVADALPPGDDERRAWHRAESIIGFDDEVAGTLHAVGRRAQDRSAYDVAATAYERGALLTEDNEERSRRFLLAGESAWLAGQLDRAQSLLAESAQLTTDERMLAEVDGVRGGIALRAGSLEDARTLLSGAASTMSGTDPDTAVVLLADLMLAHFYLADTAGAVRLAARVEDVVPRANSTVAQVRGELVVGVAHVLAGEPGINRIRSAVRRISDSPEQARDPRHPDWDVLGTLFLRESSTGRDLMERTLQELRERGALATLPTVLFYAARDDATTDRWADGVARYQEAIAMSRETGDTTALVLCLAGLSWLHARIGNSEDCTASADEAMRIGAERHVHLGRIWAMFARGELALALGDAAAAVERFEGLAAELVSIGVGDVDVSPGPELAEALVRVGRTEEGGAVARAYAEQAHAKGQPWALARAERALAMTSDGDDEAAAHFDTALTHHASTLDAYEAARTRLAYGAALRRRRQRVAARPHLRAALETFDRLGAEPWARTAAGELDATGETPQRRGAGRTAVLTAQELQIARLLAGGKTTRETAAAMFLSPKTVEYHLRHAYTKLGIHSRSELATALGD